MDNHYRLASLKTLHETVAVVTRDWGDLTLGSLGQRVGVKTDQALFYSIQRMNKRFHLFKIENAITRKSGNVNC